MSGGERKKPAFTIKSLLEKDIPSVSPAAAASDDPPTPAATPQQTIPMPEYRTLLGFNGNQLIHGFPRFQNGHGYPTLASSSSTHQRVVPFVGFVRKGDGIHPADSPKLTKVCTCGELCTMPIGFEQHRCP